MKFLISLLLAGVVASKPTPTFDNTTLYLCSDSTAAPYNPVTSPIQGYFLLYPVNCNTLY